MKTSYGCIFFHCRQQGTGLDTLRLINADRIHLTQKTFLADPLSVAGKIVILGGYPVEITENPHQFDVFFNVRDWVRGVYLMVMHTTEGRVSKKLVVE